MKLLTALLPRVIIFGLLLLLVWFNLPQLAQRHLADEIRRETGTILNVAETARTNQLDRWYLKSIDWVDPRLSTFNLLQAEEAFLTISAEALWRRQLVIEQLQLTQSRLATPRTIPLTDVAAETAPALNVDLTASPLPRVQFTNPASSAAQAWIDRIGQPSSNYQPGVSALQKKLSEFERQWTAKATEAAERAAVVKRELEMIEKLNTEQALGNSPNPLRNAANEPTPAARFASLRTEKSTIENSLSSFQQEVAILQIELERFRGEVLLSLEKATAPETLDPELANQLILGPAIAELAGEWINWIEHFREVAGKFQRDDLSPFTRGRNIVFRGMSQPPALQIDSVEMSGATVIAGQRVGLAGSVQHLSSDPRRQAEPTLIKLRAQADEHFLIEASIDRRQGQMKDTLTVHCPASPVDGLQWGSSQVLGLESGPATQQTDATFTFQGDEIDGEITVTYGDLVFLVNQLHEMLGGQNVQLLLNHELASQSQVVAKATIRGNRQQPQLELSSEWGARFANHYNRIQATASGMLGRQQAEKILNELERELDRIRMATGGKVDQVTQQLNDGSQVFARLEAWEQEQIKAGRLR